MRPWRRRRTPHPTPTPDHPQVRANRYFPFLAELESAGFLTVLTRMPGLLGLGARWAWRASPRDTVATVGFNVAAGVFTAFALVSVAGVLEALFAEGPTPERVWAALPSLMLVAGAVAAQILLQAAAGWAQARLDPQVERVAELALFDLTSRIKLEAFDDSEFNDQMARARDRGIYEVSRMINAGVDVLTGMVGMLAVAGVLTVLHPLLLALLILTVIPVGWAAAKAARLRYTRIRQMTTTRRHQHIIGGLLAERFSAAELRAYGMRSLLQREYTSVADHVRGVMLVVARRQTLIRLGGEAGSGVATLGAYVTLGALLIGGHMPLAIAGTAVLAIRQGQAALNQTLYAANSCYESSLYASDVEEFSASARAHLPRPASRELSGPLVTLSARDLVFSYPGEDEPALCGVDIDIHAGEVVALVGENGSGKTTLARLIAALYTPQGGALYWNSEDTATLDPDLLRARIGLVSQDYTQWPLSALRNVLMSDDETDRERLQSALQRSGADEVVAELKYGLDTLLDKRFVDGADLSGGQKQRMAAARGLYRHADLVIADEPTAALDAKAERRLFDTLHAAAAGATVLLITHRLASVQMADRIYVLSKGKVIEQGTHQELMAIPDGHYRELFTIQATAYTGITPS
ncbi:ABC transporter ATP-binding protein [Spiractinospora alimapuensis]|uniref:ABC transporter ATP-binding protein n=1 Tax=Spiractinospora alimapuensis TaxID=2820884 RepID=UPI001F2E9243|nr:ABC transporter ATP-binding protein [Spiractinospora alimapuensis]QVQ54530.1 ABC transporter ATP-binding protein [Spiractinospora alimapuensis]